MKKLTCLFLSMLMCMSMTVPALAEENDAWSCFTMKSTDVEAKKYPKSLDIVEGNPYNEFVNEFVKDNVRVFPNGTSFSVENLDCKYDGIYVYFKSFEVGKGSITAWEWNPETEEEIDIEIDLTGKYYGHGSFTYLTKEKDPYGFESVFDGKTLYWNTDAMVDPTLPNILLLQPGESMTFTLPDPDPNTLYSVYAAYYNSDEEYCYWKFCDFFMNDELYAQIETETEPDTEPEVQPEEDNPFTDVPADAYYHDAALWAFDNKITTGTTATTFSPEDTCTRGQVMTFLWRAKGCPEPTLTKNPFTDIKESDYYYKPILWAYENGITTGTTATTFGPKDTCSSAHVVTFLWRANGNPAAVGESSLAAENPGKWYTDAVAWADITGLLNSSDLAFAPGNNSPRGDIVTYLYLNLADAN